MPQRLLLADDSVTIQRVIELTFADEGIEVVSVGDGNAAIARLGLDRFDIVLADVGMPGRTGYDVAAFVRARPELAGVPVVLLCGAFDTVDQVRVADVGAAAMLVKPFEPQMVISTVRELLGGARPQAPAPKAEAAAPPPAPAAPASSADDYFDRLDRAFAGLNPTLEPRDLRPMAAADSASATAATAAPAPATPPSLSPSPQRATPPAGRPGSGDGGGLADTFSTLLAVEQGELPPSALMPSTPADDEMVERVARRVVEQLSDRAVREVAAEIVSRTAERLVRDEIERLKAVDPHA